MATDPTKSTTVNIRNLPTSQLAVDTDQFILQTNNGTQIIPFKDLNVVKTDITGNAVVTGALSGKSAIFTQGVRIASLTASQYFTTGGVAGFNQPTAGTVFYDSLTVVNGLVTSAIPTSVNFTSNPLYTSLYTQLTAASASIVTSTGNRICDKVHSPVIILGPGLTNGTVTIAGLPAAIGTILPTDLIITPFNGQQTTNITLSCVPFIRITDQPTVGNSYVLTCTLFSGGALPAAIQYGVRLFKTY